MANSGVKSLSSDRFYFLGLQNHYGQLSCLLLGRKAMTNLDSILKSREITLPAKVRVVTAMVFPVVTYECDSWTIKKVEYQRIHGLNCGVGGDS